jgi:aspartyl-tRNA(Asn)/glutamyl-tRNA(Gln) amidotransferase subunit B
VVELSTKAAVALNCRVSPTVRYDRKNYYYPDTPKNYQITQYLTPIGEGGQLELPSGKVRTKAARSAHWQGVSVLCGGFGRM